MPPRVEILVATYNGGRYLKDLFDSLIGQTFTDWRIIVRDDASTDDTLEIVGSYSELLGEKMQVLTDSGNVGSSRCFQKLLAASTAQVVLLADQDDVWLPNKVEKSVAALAENLSCCALAFSDLVVVDNRLNQVSQSMLRDQCLDPVFLMVNHVRMLCQNAVAGCTIALTRSAVDMVLGVGPFPSDVVHDHWIAVLVRMRGRIIFVPEPLILYRQHEANQVGAKKFSGYYFAHRVITHLASTFRHDLSFLSRLPSEGRVSVTRYILTKVLVNVRRLLVR